jgi:hypothetical protein
MDWQRERDGLVVVGIVVLVLGLAVSGRGAGMAATFVATFLGVVAALRFERWADDEASEPEPEPAPVAPGADPETPERAD